MRRFILIGLAVLLCAGLASAWFVLGTSERNTPRSNSLADIDDGIAGSGNPLDTGADNAKATASGSPSDSGDPLDSSGGLDSEDDDDSSSSGEVAREPERDSDNASDSSSRGGQDMPDQPGRSGSADDSTEVPMPRGGGPNPPPQPEVIPRSARDPTARERVARSRYSRGKLPSAADIPDAVEEGDKPPLDLTKLAEPEIWAEYWAREGYTPPEMVKTPVRGKVMSLLTNTQVPGAKVRVFTFFPATSRLNGPVLPVIMEAVADEQGYFESNLPVPARWPSDYPRYALSIEWEGKRLVDCAPYDNLRAGEDNEIGVFWAPEEPYEVEVSVTTAETGLTVAATGRVDPRRWESARAARIFEQLPQTPVGTTAAELASSWDFLKADDLPYLTLLRSARPVLTRQCVIHPDENVRIALDTKTVALFFEEAPLDQVLNRLSSEAGFPISVSDSVDPDLEINLDAGRISIKQALDRVAGQQELIWRIEDGGVVFDQLNESSSVLEIGTSSAFLPVVFPNDGSLTLSGVVIDAEGLPIEGAILSLTVNQEPQLAYSNATGFFQFHGLPDKRLTVVATHQDYVDKDVELQAGVLDASIQLPFLRPKVTLNVTDSSTDQPVTEIWINGIEVTSPYASSPKGGPLPPRHMESATGEYVFKHQKRVTFLTLQAPGFRPYTLEWFDEQGTFDVRLEPGLDLTRRPRDYDAAQNPNAFNTDEGDGPGLWSLDDDHWVEYAFDFGEDEQDFDLILGVTNQTYATLPLDNEYLFEVRVYVDGKSLGTMQIASNPTVAQLGRLNLGKLSGAHTVRLMWLNDRYIPGQLDANIRYESLRIMQVP